jgi:hypothetical protein
MRHDPSNALPRAWGRRPDLASMSSAALRSLTTLLPARHRAIASMKLLGDPRPGFDHHHLIQDDATAEGATVLAGAQVPGMARKVYVPAPPASSVTVTAGPRAQVNSAWWTYTRSHTTT